VGELEAQLSIKKLDDWYRVKIADITSRGGSTYIFLLQVERFSFLQHFGNSMGNVLFTLYPEHPWKLWKFGQVPRGFWENKQNVSEYLDWLSEQYGLANIVNDWSKLPKRLRYSQKILTLNIV
jgi:hypothetical protein